MQIQHITHPDLTLKEYCEGVDDFYFCHFITQQDIDNFGLTIHNEDIGHELNIQPGDICVIQEHKKAFCEPWYEKISPQFFKTELAKDIQVKQAVLDAANQFFR